MKKKKTNISAKEKHNAWLTLRGLHPSQRKKRKPVPLRETYNLKVEDELPPLSNNVSAIVYKNKKNVYTGTEIIGIAQMHKSNAIPVRSKKAAIEVARMRRG